MDSLRQHCLRANYLAYLVHHPSLPHTSTLLTQLLEPELSEDSEEDEDNDDEEDCCVPRRCDDSSESSDTDSIDSTIVMQNAGVDFTSNKMCSLSPQT